MPIDNFLIESLQEHATLVTNFRQGDTINSGVMSKNLAQHASKGYCRGACTDWLRHCLVREPNKPGQKERAQIGRHAPGSRVTVGHESPARVGRMAAAQFALDKAENNAPNVFAILEKKYNDAHTVLWEFLYDNDLDREGGKWARSQDATINEELDRLVDERAKAEGMMKTYLARKKEGVAVSSWSYLASAADAIANKPEGRRFSNIQAVSADVSVPLAKREDGGTAMDEPLCNMLSLQGLTPNRGMTILYGLEEDGTEGAGHGIAVFREDQNIYYLFDPNIGVFRAKSVEDLLRTTMVLLRYGYDDATRGGNTELGANAAWTLFQKRGDRPVNASQPTPEVRERLRASKSRQTQTMIAADSRVGVAKQQAPDRLRAAHATLQALQHTQAQLEKLGRLKGMLDAEKIALASEIQQAKTKYGNNIPPSLMTSFSGRSNKLKESLAKLPDETSLRQDLAAQKQEWDVAWQSAHNAWKAARMSQSEGEKLLPGFGKLIERMSRN